MTDSTNDAVPLTPLVVDVVTFDRAPLGRRGYHEDQVDEYLDRIQATLAGTDNLTAQDVREVVFDAAPLIRRGYHEDQVDDFLDLVVAELDTRERNRTARAAQRQRTPRPATRAAVPPAGASEQTSPVLPKLPAEQVGVASNPSFPAVQGPTLQPTPTPASHSQPQASASNPSFPPVPDAGPTHTDPTSRHAHQPAADTAAPYPPASGPGTPLPPAAAATHTDPTSRHAQQPTTDPEGSYPSASASGVSFPAVSGSSLSQTQESLSRHAYPPAADSGASFPAASGSVPTGNSASRHAQHPTSGPAQDSISGHSHQAATDPGASFPVGPGSKPSFPAVSAAGPAQSFAAASDPSLRPVGAPGRGPLALPLPPTPPDERGYHPADVARLVALLKEPGESPSSAAITGMRLNRMEAGQGYHAGAVDAMRAIWITELRRRGL